MIQKAENCLYCGKKMVSKTSRKRFCSDNCRVYFNREKVYNTTIFQKGLQKITHFIDDEGNKIPIPQEIISSILNDHGEIKKLNEDILDTGIGVVHHSENGEMTAIDPISDKGDKIKEYQNELAYLDAKTPLGKKRIEFLNKKIKELGN